VKGNVFVASVASDGSKNTGSGEKLTMELTDDPQAATTNRAARRATTGPIGGAFADGFGRLDKKIIRTVTLEGQGAEIRSILADADGALLRRFHLFAPVVTHDAENKRLIVPAPGRMLYEDRRPSTRPTSEPQGEPSRNTIIDARGAYAFEWQDRLTYDQGKNRAEMVGQAVIVHHAAGGAAAAAAAAGEAGAPATSQLFRLEATRVAADLEHDPGASTRAASEPGANLLLPGGASGTELKQLIADGGVRFLSNMASLAADRITFDPATGILAAHGTDRTPVEFEEEGGLSSGSFDQVSWNTHTQQIALRGVRAQVRK
jgi:hypothetical protein